MRRITITYDIVTEESAALGEVAESGWIDDVGLSCEPDVSDIEQGVSAVDNAFKLLCHAGALLPSNSAYRFGTWFSTEEVQVWQTAMMETSHYHLEGFASEEQREIFDRVVCAAAV